MMDLQSAANTLVATNRGIVAVDGRCAPAVLADLLSDPALVGWISGLVLPGPVLPDRAARRRLAVARDHGLAVGMTADTGAVPLAGCPGETVPEGLDGLAGRLRAAAAKGVTFARWRAALRIGAGTPTVPATRANAHAAARFAASCQDAGLVPLVEYRIVAGGRTALSASQGAAAIALLGLFSELVDARVDLAGLVLAPAMVLPGPDAHPPTTPLDVAEATMRTYPDAVPPEVAGVAFLDTGLYPEAATGNLAAIRRLPAPWPVTFCFGPTLVRRPAIGQLHRAWAALDGIDDLGRYP